MPQNVVGKWVSVRQGVITRLRSSSGPGVPTAVELKLRFPSHAALKGGDGAHLSDFADCAITLPFVGALLDQSFGPDAR